MIARPGYRSFFVSWFLPIACDSPQPPSENYQPEMTDKPAPLFKDIENLYVGSHESSIMHVYLGKVAAGTARAFSWFVFQKNHPRESSEWELKWQTEPLIDQAVIARVTVPKDLSDRIAELLNRLHETAGGQTLLAAMSVYQFRPASDANYDKARQFFNDNVELIPSPLQQP